MRTLRHSIVLAAGAAMLAGTGVAEASHECRSRIHAQYEYHHRALDREFHDRKREMSRAHQDQRRCVLKEIRAVERQLCGAERDAAIRELHHKLRTVDRRFHVLVRSLHSRFEERRDALRRRRDTALRVCRHECSGACQATVVAGACVGAPAVHRSRDGFGGPWAGDVRSADPRRRFEGAPPAAWDPLADSVRHGRVGVRLGDAYEDVPRASVRQLQSESDWRAMVIDLLANRLGL